VSVVVSVIVPEGVVFAADSASTLQGAAPGQTPGVLKIYDTTTKLIQLKDYPVAVATWGAGSMGARNVISYVEEFENRLPSYQDVAQSLNVSQTAADLRQFLKGKYDEQGLEQKPKGQRPEIGFVVGGYSADKFFSDLLTFSLPHGDCREARPYAGGAPNFGANWFGITEAITRLHHGCDDRFYEVLKRLGVADEVLQKARILSQTELQYPIAFNAMPLQDAVAYAEYLVNVVIGRFRFTLGPPLCGGPIDIASIKKKEGLLWVQRKRLQIRERLEGANYER